MGEALVEVLAGEPNRTSASASTEDSQLHSAEDLLDSAGTKNNKTSSSESCPSSLAVSWEVPENKISKTLVTSLKSLDHLLSNWLLLPSMPLRTSVKNRISNSAVSSNSALAFWVDNNKIFEDSLLERVLVGTDPDKNLGDRSLIPERKKEIN